MLAKINSGDRPGADRAARRAALAFGLATGGDLDSSEANVRDSDATLWFGETTTEAARATVAASLQLRKPCLPVYPSAEYEPAQVAGWIAENGAATLHVAGNTEAEEPGIEDRVEQFLGLVLEGLGHRRA